MALTPDILDAAQIVWNFHSLNHVVKPCDIMLVLGSHDLQVPEHAATLYHQKMAQFIVCSGGIAHTDDLLATGWDKTEAEIFANVLIQNGVPENVIYQEPEAKNTGDNFKLSKALLDTQNIAFQSALVITKPYMERRALATGDIQWPGKDLTISAPRAPMMDYLSRSEKGIAVEIAIMVGDIQRLKLYPAKGFMSEQPITPDVWNAFEYLVAKGFDGNIIS